MNEQRAAAAEALVEQLRVELEAERDARTHTEGQLAVMEGKVASAMAASATFDFKYAPMTAPACLSSDSNIITGKPAASMAFT